MNGHQNHEEKHKKSNLHSLLSHTSCHDWKPIYDYIQHHPHEASDRYYRHESPLQLALKAKEGSPDGRGSSSIRRLQVLRALAEADPASIHSRDEEGRTCLHTACSAGRTEDTLQWLMEVEACQSPKSYGVKCATNDESSLPEWNVTLRTDFPGGALPLHSVAACARFDRSSVAERTALRAPPHHPIHTYLSRCPADSPNILCAYNATTRILRAYPPAVWDRDCEGELPLHAAASWGNLGAVLALLRGAAPGGERALTRAALTADDRQHTPLSRASERVCSLCVHGDAGAPPACAGGRRASGLGTSGERRRSARTDPFETEATVGRRSLLRRTGSGRRRIPGCGSSFRASFSSSFVHSAVLENDAEGIPDEPLEQFRASFISPRQPIEACRGLMPLDGDGEEEFAKVEILARAASGVFDVDGFFREDDTEPDAAIRNSVDRFPLLHAVIALDCKPEIIWHAANTYPQEMLEKDKFGRTPLFIACQRLTAMYSSRAVKAHTSPAAQTKEALSLSDKPRSRKLEEDGSNDDDSMNTRFVESFLLGGDLSLLQTNHLHPSTYATSPQSANPHQLPKKPSYDLSLTQEVIAFLLHSPQFGRLEMACTENAENRLPLHVVLEAGLQWTDRDVHRQGYGVEAIRPRKDHQCDHDDNSNTVVHMLVDACPRALEVQDGETRLFPFMVAATPKKALGALGTSNECTRQLGTVYHLLRKAPTVLCHNP